MRGVGGELQSEGKARVLGVGGRVAHESIRLRRVNSIAGPRQTSASAKHTH